MISKEEWDNMLIERHTKDVHNKLSNSKVIIMGLGGLGSNVATSLTRVGIGELCIVDFDIVEKSNLNRQAYMIKHLGMYKTEALKSLLLEINPFLKIKTHCIKVNEDNIESLTSDYDIICEAFDSPEAKAMLVNYVLENMPNKKIISSSGMAGYESSNTIKTSRITKNFYLCGDRVTGIEEGLHLMAPRVGICAYHEANMIVRLLLGNENV